MDLSFEAQTQGFLYACAVGFLLGAFYDFFRILRVFLRCDRRPVFFQDLFCCCVTAVVTFLLALAVNWGEIRFYLLAGQAIGVCVYFLTLGEITVRLARAVFHVLRRIWRFLRRWIFGPLKRVGLKAGKLALRRLGEFKKTLKKPHKIKKTA